MNTSKTNGLTTYFWYLEYSIISCCDKNEVVIVGRWFKDWFFGCGYFDKMFINWSMGYEVIKTKKPKGIISMM